MVTVRAFRTIQDCQDSKLVYQVIVYSPGALERERQTAKKEKTVILLYDDDGNLIEGNRFWDVAAKLLKNPSVTEWLETMLITDNDPILNYMVQV